MNQRYDRIVGRMIAGIGVALVVIGLLIMLAERYNLPFGHLPGDIAWQGKNGSFYCPIVSCIVLSLVLTLGMWLWGKLRP
jgi:hypothetical protein